MSVLRNAESESGKVRRGGRSRKDRSKKGAGLPGFPSGLCAFFYFQKNHALGRKDDDRGALDRFIDHIIKRCGKNVRKILNRPAKICYDMSKEG